MAEPLPGRCKFGAFELDPGKRSLLKNGRKVKVQEQPFQILWALVESRGEVVTREELRRRLWPADTYVDYDNSLGIAVGKLRQALNDDASKPRFIETLPRVGYRFIAPVEAVRPDSQDQKQVAAIPAAIESLPAGPAPVTRRSPRWSWALILAALLLCLGFWIPFASRSRSARAAVQLRPAVAVMGFRNQTNRADRDWESTAFSEWLAVDLEDGERVRTIPGETVARTRIDLKLPQVDAFAKETLARIRRNTGADYVVAGSFFDTSGPSGGSVQLNLRMQDTSSGETVRVVSRTGSAGDLPGLVKQASVELRQKLGFRGQIAEVAAGSAPARVGSHAYFEGLDRLRRFDAQGARDLLEQAVTADPNDALAHHALSQAWAALGYAELAKREAQKAWQLSSNLPRADRMSIEASYRMANVEWEKAIRIYAELRDLFPDNADYGLRLAHAQIEAGNARDALVTLDKIHRLPAPAADDAAIAIVQAEAAGKLGDFERARRYAAAAAATAQERGAQILVAEARAQECRQLIQLSRLQPAAEACESARQIYTSAGDRAGLASATGYLASARYLLGDLPAARSLYEQALDIDQEIGNEGTALWERNGLAIVRWQEGDLGSARRQYEESLRIARLISSRPDEADALENVGFMCLLVGELKEARRMLEQALALFQAIGDQAGAGSVWNNLGQVMYFAGDLPGAARLLDQAVAADRATGFKLEAADALSWSGRVRLAQADYAGAKQRFDEALRAASETGNADSVAQCRLKAAALSVATGNPADAEHLTREALEQFERGHRDREAVETRIALAATLLDEGKAGEAARELDRAAAAKASQKLAAQLEFSIAAARVAASAGKAGASAGRELQTAIAAAGAHGFVSYELQGRLAAVEIASKRGDRSARPAIDQLVHDAHAKGFEDIARQAASLPAGRHN